MTITKRKEAILSILCCCIIVLPKALSLRCYFCDGDVNVNCENTLMEIECKPVGNLVHDSCFTLTRVMNYPFIGISYEQIKNCSVFSRCDFLQSILCDNPDGFVSNCSINCCTGDLCNGNRTLVDVNGTTTDENVTSTITDENVKRTLAKKNVTSTITNKNATSTITDKNVPRTRTDKYMISTIESVDVVSTTQNANTTSFATHVHTTIINMHASSTSTSMQLYIKSTISDETTSSKTLNAGITATRPYEKMSTTSVRHEWVTSTFTQSTNSSNSKSSIGHVPSTVTRARDSGMQMISSASWEEIHNATEALPTLPIADGTRLIAAISSVTSTTATSSSQVVDVYGAGAERISTQLTSALFLVTLIVVMTTE